MQQLEQELKFDVPRSWALPDLSGVLPGVQAAPLPALRLVTTYFDTADLRLAHHGVTLRHRHVMAEPGKPRGRARQKEEWTVKLPASAGAGLARTEVTWPARRSRPRAPGAGAGTTGPVEGAAAPARPRLPAVPKAAANLVRDVCLGLPLRPVARLEADRQRLQLRASDGRPLAEVDYDSVAGYRLVGHRRSTHFREVEVELAPGSSAEVLQAAAARLQAAGAAPSGRASKLLEVLGPEASSWQPARPGPGSAQPGASVAAVLPAQVGACLEELLAHGPAIRLARPDPEHVHRARVAVRRTLSLLGPANRSGADEQLARLRHELSWLAQRLGRARDADVRAELLRASCDELPPADADGARALLERARGDQRRARAQLLAALRSQRYLALLRSLEDFSPATAPGPAEAPAVALGAVVQRNWRSLSRAVGHSGDQATDDALHRARVRAKHLRYTLELLAGKRAHRAAAAATRLQDVLGQLHDAALAEAWLREAAAAAPSRAGLAVAAGQLIARSRASQSELRAAWPSAWSRLRKAVSKL